MNSILNIFIVLFALNTWANTPVVSANDMLRLEQLRVASESELVRRALDEEKAFRDASHGEIKWFMSQIASHLEGASDVKERVLSRMRRDLVHMQALNARFAQLSPVKGEITWSCQANKLVEIITAAISFYEDNAHLILRDILPAEFSEYWEQPRCLGACEGRSEGHNARELALKASLLLTWLELSSQEHLQETSIPSFEDSPIVHSTPLPSNTVLDGIQKLSFFYNGTLSPNQGELGFVHGGYAFGGQNDDSRYKHLGVYGKRFGPQDCSSYISKLLSLPQVMSTIDFAAIHRDFAKVEGECPTEFSRFEPVFVRSFDDVRPGMFRVTRRYDLSKDPEKTLTLGTSGHALLVVDVDLESQTMLTLEYARDLPAMEGFGVRRVPFTTPDSVKPMYFVAH